MSICGLNRAVVVVGGHGCVGRYLVDSLVKCGYLAISVDFTKNDSAPANIVIPRLSSGISWKKMSTDVLHEVRELTHRQRLAGLFCTAGGWQGGHIGSDEGLDAIQSMWEANTVSSIMSAYVASNSLSPSAALVIISSSVSLGPTPGMIGYGLSKNATNFLLKSISCDSNFPPFVRVFGILPTTIDTPANRNAMPSANFSNWTKASEISEKCVEWVSDTSAHESSETPCKDPVMFTVS